MISEGSSDWSNDAKFSFDHSVTLTSEQGNEEAMSLMLKSVNDKTSGNKEHRKDKHWMTIKTGHNGREAQDL